MANLTLLDWAKRLDPNGSVSSVAELMTETNAILEDAIFVEGNLPTGHRSTIRTGIPSATWRRLNYGVPTTKSTTVQVDDTIGMLEDYAEVDKDLAMLNGNTAEFRLTEDHPHIEGISQQLAQTLFYGDTGTNPERFLGLSPRYSALASPTKPAAASYMSQVINAGASSGDCSSMWLVVWGPNTVHMIFPKGSKAGILQEDLGEVTLEDASGGKYQGFRSHYQVKAGLVVRDWRYIVRIANIDPDAATTFDHTDLIQAVNTVPNMGMGKAVFYCTRQVKTRLDIAAQAKANAALSIKDVFGKPVTHFWNTPIKQCDQILETEVALT